MDENTRFLIEHIDRVEQRLLLKLEEYSAFKHRIIGGAAVVSGFCGLIGSYLMKRLGV